MKMVNGQQIIQLFEEFAPKKYALEGDPIGLQIGTLNKPVHNVMVALDVLEEVVDEAIANNVDLIIAHHPIIFRPLKKLVTDNTNGRIVEKLIKHDIAVYAAHTNLDVTPGGVNDMLAKALQLENIEVLSPTMEESNLGLGRIGTLKSDLTLEEFAKFVKGALDAPGVRVVGDLTSKVRKVAVLGGDGNKYFSQAKFKGADVYVTGDFYYHTAHDAMNMGLNIVDPGHNVEKIMKQGTVDVLNEKCAEKQYDVRIFISEIDTNPFKFL